MSLKNVTKIRVIYADTDAMGIVYHANYIKWFEIGRGELLRQLGIPYTAINHMGYDLPLTEVSCQYRCPARYDQILLLETEMTDLRGASIKFCYVIWDERKEKVIVEGESVQACLNKQGRIVRFPQEIIGKIKPAR